MSRVSCTKPTTTEAICAKRRGKANAFTVQQIRDIAVACHERTGVPYPRGVSRMLKDELCQYIWEQVEAMQETSLEDVKVEYLPVPSLADLPENREHCLQYLQNYVNPVPFTRGGYGSVHDVCTDAKYQDCSYVAKVVYFAAQNRQRRWSDPQYWPNAFMMEEYIARRAGEQGYGVPVMDAFYCENKQTGVIIYEKWDGTLNNTQLRREDVATLLGHVNAMHRDGIMHQDLFTKNVLFKDTGSGLRLGITDFGMALMFEKALPDRIRACDFATLLYGWYTENRWAENFRYSTAQGTIPEQREAAGLLAQSYVGGTLIYGIQSRVNKSGTLENPRGRPPVVWDMQDYYVTILNLMPDALFPLLGSTLRNYVVWALHPHVPVDQRHAIWQVLLRRLRENRLS